MTDRTAPTSAVAEPATQARREKVVLYNPRAVFYTMPLALLAVASHLDRTRFDVVIVDARLEADPHAALVAALQGALCLGVTVLTGAPLRDALDASRVAKAHHPALPIVWGGWHPSMFGRECLAEPAVTATVQGQGEDTFAEVVDRLARGEALDGCLGTTCRAASGAIIANPPRPVRPVEAFAPHDYSLIPVERYYTLKGKRQLDYVSSQGCNFRCAFCADPFVYERQWFGLSPERMVGELTSLWQRYRFDDVNFQDETFFTRRDRVEAIAQGMVDAQLPITWAGTMRADQGARLPDASMALCRRSGLRRALIGVESGSDEMLRRIRKDTRIAQVFESADKIHRHGINGQFPFIVGFPGESDESVQASLDVAKRLRRMSADFRTPFFYFKPYPGTAITEAVVKDGGEIPQTLDDWAAFDFVGSVGGPWVSPEKFRRVERFKYFQQVAWDRAPAWQRPLQQVARWRCEGDRYALPIEMWTARLLGRPERLS